MEDVISAPLFAGGLFLGMLVCLEIGRRIGLWRMQHVPKGAEASQAGLGVVEGAFFGLFSLLVAFSFSGAAGRFDERRALVVEEANHIGTAYLRLDVLAPEAQPALRDLFRRYTESRLETYRKLPDLDAALKELARSVALQNRIWSQAVAASRAEGSHPSSAMLVLPALNQMIDITTTRTMAARTHPPKIIYRLLFGMGLLCAAIAGHGMAAASSRAWAHIVGFALIMSISIFVILDIEYPRLGFIRVDAHDQVLVEVLESMR
ncbi:MAG TPA: DUF4239 domain-containing protein [Thermoanaerobaculia bacterium]